ncbi:hypothetical protein NA78x_000143 [Anatilimnocola sp. NA78]|uniref:hypothetical protein n=1 Tax=Anatilimnocola sp. NA78 TaxID=3415683 RepID=UPI003CE45B94
MLHDPRYLIYWRLPVFIVSSYFAIIAMLLWDEDATEWAIGIAVGQCVLAAAWLAFGPADWYWRLLVSAPWSWVICAALTMHWESAWEFRPPFLLISVVTLELLLIPLIPVLVIAHTFHLQMNYEDLPDGGVRSRPQFGLGGLLIYVTFLACVLGVDQLVNRVFFNDAKSAAAHRMIQICIALPAAVNVPLICLLLLKRFYIVIGIGYLTVAFGVMMVELPISKWLLDDVGVATSSLLKVNLASAGCVVAFALAARYYGYQFRAPALKTAAMQDPQ